MVQCKAKSKRTGERCRRDATPGKEVCYYHGGAPGSGKGKHLIKHGRYAKSLPADLAERYEHFQNDPDVLSLIPEIALLRTHLERFMSTYTDGQGVSSELGAEVRAWADTVSKACEKASKILYGEKYTLTVEQVQVLMMYRIPDVINAAVTAWAQQKGLPPADVEPLVSSIADGLKELGGKAE